MVGARIKEYLRSHGIKQTFLGEKIGVNGVRMAQIINGKTINCVTYYKICKALDVPYEYFLSGEDE